MLFVASLLLLATTAVNSQVPVSRDYHMRNSYDEAPKPYSFSYKAVLDDGIGEIFRTETKDDSGRVQGSYSLTNDEGHTRIVDYIADEYGFRAHVRTNEPGTDNQNPADVVFESSNPYANRNYQYTPQAGRPMIGRPVLNAHVPDDQPHFRLQPLSAPNSGSYSSPPRDPFGRGSNLP